MRHRAPLFLLLLAPFAAACFQELDPCAAGGANCPAAAGPQNSTSTTGLVYADGGVCPEGMIVGGGDGLGGHGVCIPADTMTPSIQLNEVDDGAATSDPCVKVEDQSMAIRTSFCAPCHGGGTATMTMAGFGAVLDDAKLATLKSNLAFDDAGLGVRLLIPGDPDHSRLYNFVASATMPPTGNPKPTISDISILRSWITCMGQSSGSGGSSSSGGGGTSNAPPSSGAAGDAGTD